MQPLYDTTKAIENIFHTIDKILLEMEYFFKHFENFRHNYCKHGYLNTCIDVAWVKFDKYYNKSNITIVYFVATTLNLFYK